MEAFSDDQENQKTRNIYLSLSWFILPKNNKHEYADASTKIIILYYEVLKDPKNKIHYNNYAMMIGYTQYVPNFTNGDLNTEYVVIKNFIIVDHFNFT